MKQVSKKTKKILSTFIILILMTLVLYKMLQGSFNEIVIQIKKLDVLSIILILILSLSYQIVEGIILTKIMKKHKKDFHILEGIQTIFQGCFYRGITFGSGTQAGQIYFLLKKDIEPAQSMSSLTLSYAMHKIGVFIYVTICLLLNYSFFYTKYKSYMIYIAIGYLLNFIIVLFLVLIVVSEKFHKLIIFILEKLFKKEKYKEKIQKVKKQINSLPINAHLILKDKILLIKIIILELIKFSCWYVIPYIVLTSANLKGLNYNIFQIISVTAFINVLVGVIPAPSGIMSTELVFTALFSILVGKASAGATMIIYRFSTYIVPFIFGIFSWLIKRGKRGTVHK